MLTQKEIKSTIVELWDAALAVRQPGDIADRYIKVKAYLDLVQPFEATAPGWVDNADYLDALDVAAYLARLDDLPCPPLADLPDIDGLLSCDPDTRQAIVFDGEGSVELYDY